jgi:hypothetical protein
VEAAQEVAAAAQEVAAAAQEVEAVQEEMALALMLLLLQPRTMRHLEVREAQKALQAM